MTGSGGTYEVPALDVSTGSASEYARRDGHAPLAVELRDDPGVMVGNVAGLPAAGIGAAVSLCRVGPQLRSP